MSGLSFEQKDMIWSESFQVIDIIRDLGYGAVIENSLHLAQDSMQAFIIQRLLSQNRKDDLSKHRDESLPHTAMMGCGRGVEQPITPLCRRTPWIFLWSMAFLNSRSTPTKFVPLSDLKLDTWPLRHTNLYMALTQESMSRKFAISKCTAVLVMQVNITQHLLTIAHPLLTSMGPK